MKSTNIAIIGNPNCGKTTLFNRLTGARQKTGNWPGVTVERISGKFKLEKHQINLQDLPGIYSLHDTTAIDAQIANQYLQSQTADTLIYVLDANNLERQLLLLQQIQRLNIPLIVAITMLDMEQVEIDISQLEACLGVPVCAIVAGKNQGINELKQHIKKQLDAKHTCQRFDIPSLCQRALKVKSQANSLPCHLDKLALHPIFGLPIFFLVIYLTFAFAVNVGGIFIDFFDQITGVWLVESSSYYLSQWQAPVWLITLISDGLASGIQLIATFIPVIACLYLALSTLEDSGYMARAAFMVDGLMQRMGLPGQAFIPLIVGFGCNVPSVMASRSLTSTRARLITIFIAPFMSCGARLTVYVFIGAAFFPDQAQNAIFALYLLGVAVAVLSAIFIHRFALPLQHEMSIQEMPHWHKPQLRNILQHTYHRVTSFCLRAGKSILLVVCVLAMVSSYGTDGQWGHKGSENSYLAAGAKQLTPIFSPIGITEDNWPATVGLATGLFAKEIVVGTLDTLYQPSQMSEIPNKPEYLAQSQAALMSIVEAASGLTELLLDPLGLGQADYQGEQSTSVITMQGMFSSGWSAFAYLVLILLYAPCVATIGAMVREGGNRWMFFSVQWSLVLSYALGVIIYQLSIITLQPTTAALWIIAMVILVVSNAWLLFYQARKQESQLIAVG